MTDLDAVRTALERLRLRLATGEISREEYREILAEVTGTLTAQQCSELGVTPTPRPQSGSGIAIGPSGGRTRIPTLAELEIEAGTVLLDQWRIVRELGRGGFGAVFEAEDIKLGRTLAVKVLDPAMAAKEELLARFRREVTLMRELAYERIVRVYDYREEAAEHLALITMEYVRGCSVREVLGLARASREPVPVALAVAIFEQTLEALAAAHAQGVIHRDVTPGNILLAGGTAAELMSDPECDPRVKLVDFGIAGLVKRTELSAKSRVLGTAAYVAPEVLDPDAEITAGADVFGAGAVVYDLLTGKTPMVTGYRPVRGLRAEVPAGVGEVLDTAVRPTPGERPSASEALGALARGKAGAARGEEQQRQAEDARRREREDGGRTAREEARREAITPEAVAPRPQDATARPRGAAPAAGSKERASRSPVVPPLVTGLVLAALVLVMVGIWLKSSRGWVFSPPPEATPSGLAATPVAEARQTPAPPSEVAAKATLVIRSNVAGDVVWLDGRELGPTRQEAEVEPGRHLVRVTKEGCAPEERWVELRAGGLEDVFLELECATPVPTTRPATATPVPPTRTATATSTPAQAAAAGPKAGSAWTDPAVGMRFRYIPAGSFEMGSPSSEAERKSDERKHRVTLTRGYWMGETEVTQGQWRAVMGTNPSRFSSCGDSCPVEQVSWLEAVGFANRLSRRAGYEECYRISGESVSFVGLRCKGYRLPTEAEWERAARAGTTTPFWAGGNLTTEQANYDGKYPYARNRKGVYRQKTVAVKRFPANAWGLYEVHGNVWEWVWDWHGEYPSGAVTDPTGPSGGSYRVIRGGSWDFYARGCRSAGRGRSQPGYRNGDLGLRLVRTAG